MILLIGLFWLLQVPANAENCPINCRDCNGTRCYGCRNDWFGERCEHRCRADKDTCSICSEKYSKVVFKSYSRCHGCELNEYFSNGTCKSCPYNCDSCTDNENCTACKKDYVGQMCQIKCPSNCFGCHAADNCISCKTGWSGRACELRCGHCKMDTKCDRLNGSCKHGCADGYFGVRCHRKCGHCLPDSEGTVKCDLYSGICKNGCADGYFGLLCDRKCGLCLPDSEGTVKCDLYSGICKNGCVDGYFGLLCDQGCGHCLPDSEGTVKCDHYSGICKNGCVDGYFGLLCDRKCGHCLPDSEGTVKCDNCSGICKNGCADGYFGPLCDRKCGHCLPDSEETVKCDHYSGICKNGCADGYFVLPCDQGCSHCITDSEGPAKCDLYNDSNTCSNICSFKGANMSCDQNLGHWDNGCVSAFDTGSDAILNGFIGWLVGVTMSLLIAFVVWYVRRMVKKRKRYVDLELPDRLDTFSIYDDILDTGGSMERQSSFSSHSYMEVGSDSSLWIIRHSGKRSGASETPANTVHMSLLRSDTNRLVNDEENTTQSVGPPRKCMSLQANTKILRKCHKKPDLTSSIILNAKDLGHRAGGMYESAITKITHKHDKVQYQKLSNERETSLKRLNSSDKDASLKTSEAGEANSNNDLNTELRRKSSRIDMTEADGGESANYLHPCN